MYTGKNRNSFPRVVQKHSPYFEHIFNTPHSQNGELQQVAHFVCHFFVDTLITSPQSVVGVFMEVVVVDYTEFGKGQFFDIR